MKERKTPFLCAITGMGALVSAAERTDQVWDMVLRGESILCDGRSVDPNALPYPFFSVPDRTFEGGRRSQSVRDTLHLARKAACEAMADARGIDLDRLGVFIGTTSGCALHFLKGYAACRTHEESNFQDILSYFGNSLAFELGQYVHAKGPCLVISNACTSGADAIGRGYDAIRMNLCDAVLCGGADTISLVSHTGFARLMVASQERSRPFDRNRCGLNLGEGAAMLLLESVDSVKRRNAAILGYVAGYGSASDAYHTTAPHPEAIGLRRAVDDVMREISVDELAFINAHATGTRENDKVEGRFLKQFFPSVPIWASKSVTGHTLGCAGALEALLCILALQKGRLPATRNFHDMDPEINIVPTQEESVIHKPYALSTSLGFGGVNSALLLRRYG